MQISIAYQSFGLVIRNFGVVLFLTKIAPNIGLFNIRGKPCWEFPAGHFHKKR